MRVLLLIAGLTALVLKTEAQNNQALNRTGWNITDLNKTSWDRSGLNRTQWDRSGFNRTQWDRSGFNRTQWEVPAANRTQWNPSAFNRTQWNPSGLNRSQWNIQNVNRTQRNAPTFNRTQWNLSSFNRTQWGLQSRNLTLFHVQNRTQWNLDQPQIKNRTSLNSTLWNSGGKNLTGLRRTVREVPRWVSPPTNGTWNQTTHNGDVIVGQIGHLDRLLFNQTYIKERRWWSGREKIIEYPNDVYGKYYNRQETITAIRIYNKFYDGLESQAKILSGGVGYRYVKIELSSPWSRGFHYLVQIFGR